MPGVLPGHFVDEGVALVLDDVLDHSTYLEVPVRLVRVDDRQCDPRVAPEIVVLLPPRSETKQQVRAVVVVPNGG